MAQNSRNSRGLQLLCQRQLLEPFTRFSTRHQHTIANKSLEESSIFRSQYHIKPAHNIEEALKLINAYFEYITGEHSDRRKTFRKTKQRLKPKARTNRKKLLVKLLEMSFASSPFFVCASLFRFHGSSKTFANL